MRYLHVVEKNIKGFNINEESALQTVALGCLMEVYYIPSYTIKMKMNNP